MRATASAADLAERQRRGDRHRRRELHGANNNLTKQTALTEKGTVVNGRGDTPNMHDILTGSQPDGTAFAGRRGQDLRQLDEERGRGAAMLGHHDRMGLPDGPPANSWNSSHPLDRGGCSHRISQHRRRRAALLLRAN